MAEVKMTNGLIDAEFLIYYYGTLFGIVVVSYLGYKFCYKKS